MTEEKDISTEKDHHFPEPENSEGVVEGSAQSGRIHKDINIHYNGNLRVVRKIASGGMGDVYLAEQIGAEGFKKTVALKSIKMEMLKKKDTFNMFVSEAKLVADLIHENILQVYNLCSTEDELFIVMEYLKGITLMQFIRRHRELKILPDTQMAAFIISRTARALSYAHHKKSHEGNHLGVVHRDVTPANIMIDGLGVVKLTDFGIAKGLAMGSPDEKKVLMGKYPYMSPEQVYLKGTDSRSDLYSLGLVFYQSLTGIRLYPASSREELLGMLKETKIDPPEKHNPKIEKELSDIVMSCLAFDPKNRIKSSRLLVLSIEKYLYSKGYGPTNEKLAIYMRKIFRK